MVDSSMLILESPSLAMWERFQRGEDLRKVVELQPLLLRWQRCRDLGAQGDGPSAPVSVSSGDLAVRRDRAAAVFAEAGPILDRVTTGLTSRGVVALLADVDGVILLQRGGGKFLTAADRARIVEGSQWNEATRGTNAVGTALAEQRAVAVKGRAHYERAAHGLFCYGSPIKDPSGQVVAVLDVSGKLADDDPSFGFAIETAAAAVERVLRARAYSASVPGGLRLIESMLQRCAMAALIVEAPGVITHVNDKAGQVFGVAPVQCEGRSVESLFGVPYQTLCDEALSPGRGAVRVETDVVTCHAELEPLFLAPGRPFAMVVYLEPDVPFSVQRRDESGPSRRPSAPLMDAVTALRGSDPAFTLAKIEAERLSSSDEAFMVVGETGAGKKRVVRAIHETSRRREAPFVVVDCARLAASAVEELLFGRARSGTSRAAVGAVEQNVGGTLYLEGAALLPSSVHAALAALIRFGTYRRVGEARVRRADVRVVLASDAPRSALGRELLEVMPARNVITLPALRNRSDKVELAIGALREDDPAGDDPWELSDEARARISRYEWPGNLAELFPMIKLARTLAGASRIVGERELTSAANKLRPKAG